MELVSVQDYEEKAAKLIPKHFLDYYKSGAGDEFSLKLNRKYFQNYRIRPRFLRDVSSRDLSCNIFGHKIDFPIGICPTAMQKLASDEGEVANAKAAGDANLIFILSTIATCSIEEVAKGAPNTIKWFQLYIYKDREITKSLVRRAEESGYKAIVLTIDAPIFGLRRADMKNQFMLPGHLKYANFTDDKSSGDVKGNSGLSGLNQYVTNQFDPTLNWNDVQWLVNFTKLPVIIKGVLTKEDALLAVEYGCKGIIVSNHGARQLDYVPATIEALPEIVSAVGNKTIVMLDGGIMQGTDIFKAIGLGAKMVFIGRPSIWGLAVNGKNGVKHILEILKHELDNAMALSGCKTIKNINSDMVVHKSYYSKL